MSQPVEFIRKHAAKILTTVLLVQAAVFYGFSGREYIPHEKALAAFDIPSPDWSVSA